MSITIPEEVPTDFEKAQRRAKLRGALLRDVKQTAYITGIMLLGAGAWYVGTKIGEKYLEVTDHPIQKP